MKRIVPIAGGLLLAAWAFWHPAPRAAGFAAVAATPPQRRRRSAAVPARPQALVVYVAGAVARPGLYRLRSGDRADAAVRLAGGMRADADPGGVNLAERVADGEEIAVPVVGAPIRRAARGRRTRTASPPPSPVDLNTAGAEDLARIPGIGPSLGKRIAAFRDANGPFAHLDELLDVAGMTPARLDRASPYLSI